MVEAGFQVQELDANVGGGILAGALAFRLFLFMVPFVYVVFTILGALARALGQDPAQVARNAGITGILASAVVKVDDLGGWTQAALVLGAIVTLFITSGALMKALYVVYWLIWLRREAPCCIPGSTGRNLEDIPGSDGLLKIRKVKGTIACQETGGRANAYGRRAGGPA